MTTIFISYSQVDRSFVELLAAHLRRMYGHGNVWFDERLYGGDIWWEEILNQIAEHAIFIYILSNESVESAYCQAEFAEARRLHKQIITVQARDRTRLSPDLGDIHYIDMAQNVNDGTALTNLYRSVDKRMTKVSKRKPKPLRETPTPNPGKVDEIPRPDNASDVDTPTLTVPAAEQKVFSPINQRSRQGLIVAGFIFVLSTIIGILLFKLDLIRLGNRIAFTSPTLTWTPSITPTNTPTLTWTPSITPTNIPTLTWTPSITSTNTPTLTWTPSITSTNTPTLTWTPSITPTETLSPTEIILPPAATWKPLERAFDGIPMVLVPEGCFIMGSDSENINEQPAHLQCFTEPFWIGKTEITNAQYGSTGCRDWSSEPNQPRNCVNWFAAREFCEAHGGRLPTEAEWEYAARGIDSLIYPWGNEYVSERIVYVVTSNRDLAHTAAVGTRPSGASWVDALGMAGNLREWTSSLSMPYPYDANDGREQVTGIDFNIPRVLRGSAFFHTDNCLHSACRFESNPATVDIKYGFRCARDY